MRRMGGCSAIAQPSSGQAHGAEIVLERLPETLLVTCPVAMMPAVSDNEKVRFHTLNRATETGWRAAMWTR